MKRLLAPVVFLVATWGTVTSAQESSCLARQKGIEQFAHGAMHAAIVGNGSSA